ncbi:hypothetical protein [Flavobacterium sp. SM2513]|uniref:hypothetical protein n=1 Tax=Flavobacterium sp. SM2513 TaxID=3424766 RepID=UPI003D7F4F72
MKNWQLLTFMCIFSILLASCHKKKDIIEIYLTKNKIESYDGVPLRVGIKNSIIIKQVVDIYGEGVRVDTLAEKLIYMGHFNVKREDLEEKPFINNAEILGFDFEKSEIHFSESVTEKIYNALPIWHKENYFGKQFALCHNGTLVLTGYMYGSMSKFHSTTYQIVYHHSSAVQRKNEIKSVAFSVYDSLNVEENHLLKDNVFYNTFKNRLISK